MSNTRARAHTHTHPTHTHQAAATAAGEAAKAAEKRIEALQSEMAKAQEQAGKAAAAAEVGHAAVVKGLNDMLAQSEADYAQLKTAKDVAEALAAEAQREAEVCVRACACLFVCCV